MNEFLKYVFELFTWKGRIGRFRFLTTMAFIWSPVWIVISAAILLPFLEMQSNYRLPEKWVTILIVLFFAYLCIGIFLNVFNTIKRLHDLDQTGWICLIYLVPYVGIVLLIYLLFWEGTKGVNKYGDSPLW